jgi:hypothetical protein
MRPVLNIVLGTLISFAAAGQTAPAGPASSYPNSEQGLSQMFHDLLDAYKASDGHKVTALLLRMRLSDKWFTDNFGADEAHQLSARYAEVFARFKSRSETRLAKFVPTDELSIKATETKGTSKQVTATYLVTPKNPVKLQSYQLIYTSPQQGRIEWVDTFVYDTGAFRYVGSGAFPFWAQVSIRAGKLETH